MSLTPEQLGLLTTQFAALHDDNPDGSLDAEQRERLEQQIIEDRDITILNHQTGELLRHLTLDPTRNYQPQNTNKT